MELLSLEFSEYENPEIFNNIDIITNIDESDINIEIYKTSEGNIRINYFTDYEINSRKCIDKIVGCVTRLLIEYTKKESNNYLKENYFYFEDEEYDEIKETIEDEITNDIKIQLIIKNKFREIMENSKTINLNGFIKFRLKFISLYVIQLVEKSIDNYLMKKEYLDFISIIRYIADAEEREYDIVNIMYNNNRLQVYDSSMKKLTYIGSMELSGELDNESLKYDEAVINILLTVSPKKIVLHTDNLDKDDVDSVNTLDVIKRIFNGKIEFCKGCRFCNLNLS